MQSTVKKIEVNYNPINEQNTFTNGDVVCGEVRLEVAKTCEVDFLYIKFKGKAEVLWTERHGNTTHTYHSKDKYFSVRQYFVQDKNLKHGKQIQLTNQSSETYSNVLPPGIHVYRFSFQFPHQNIPPSFKGAHGKIVYLLEARLSRSLRMDKTESTKLSFVPRPDLSPASGVMTPQHESKDKKMNIFTSGTVAMDVQLEKSGFCQGEQLKVLAFIKNDSSREIKPKYCIYTKHSFFARGKRRLHCKDLIKEVGAPIAPCTSQNVTQVITIPREMEPSIMNCSIIKVEYRLRVYLDVKYASDPEIKFNIFILPAFGVPAAASAPPAAAGFGYEPFGNLTPPVWGVSSPPPPFAPQPSDPPPPYGAYGMYPPLNDFNNKF
uniref:Arrestin C-terminal-like domain-containing protein n=1 Tax=Nothobranchius kadleci TaxID=1051664 RepID=A0A1A8CF09_NOTKA|nr:arrestin domain-containing protein 3 [Nothobranchius furzeri]